MPYRPLNLPDTTLRRSDEAALRTTLDDGLSKLWMTQAVDEHLAGLQRMADDAVRPHQAAYDPGGQRAPSAPSSLQYADDLPIVVSPQPEIGQLSPSAPEPEPVVSSSAEPEALAAPTAASAPGSAAPSTGAPGVPSRGGSFSAGVPEGDPEPNVERWSPIVDKASAAYGVPQAVIKGIMHIESGGRTHDAQGRPLRSSAGAISLMQTMPFHYQPGEDPDDPETNIMRGTKILADNFRRYGDWDKAAAAYFGAIDADGNVTSANDGSSVDGHAYVRLFRGAASRYGGSQPAAPAPRNAGTGGNVPAPATAPAPSAASPSAQQPSSGAVAPSGNPQGSGPIRVRDQWGNEWNTTQEILDRRSGGSADLTIVSRAASSVAAAGGAPWDSSDGSSGWGASSPSPTTADTETSGPLMDDTARLSASTSRPTPLPVDPNVPASVRRARAREQANGAPVLAQSLQEQTASDVGVGQAPQAAPTVSPYDETPPYVPGDDARGREGTQPAPVSPYDETPPYVAPQMASGAAAEDLPPQPPAPFVGRDNGTYGPESVPLSQADYEEQARSASQQPPAPPATGGKAWKRPKPIYDAATGEITGYVQEAEEEQTPGVLGAAYDAARAGLTAGGAALTPQSVPEAIEASTGLNPMTLAVPGANPLARRVVNAYNAGVGAAGDVLGRRAAQAAGVSDEPIVPGVPVSGQDVAGYAGGMALDPTTYAGGGGVAKSVAREAPGVIRRVGASAADAAAPIVERGRRVAAGVGRGLAGEILDRTIAPRAVGEAGPGIGRALVDTAEAAPRHVYNPTAPEGSVRRYHGTAGAFDAADPMRFDNDGLYGPGYYTTSDPRVAGSYAEARDVVNPKAEALRQMIEDIDARLDSHAFNNAAEADALRSRRTTLRQQMEAAGADVQSGPNVRAVDLPSDMNMLDADAPLTSEAVQRVRRVIARIQRAAPEIAGPISAELDHIEQGLARGIAYPNETLISALMDQSRLLGPTLDGYPGGKRMMTDILERAGYDGINHTGGKRVPMMDGAGNPIEHDVSIVFPGSINKVRNALSGTQGGGYLPFDPASAAAGAAAGGETDEDGDPTYDPMRTAGGMMIAGVVGRKFPQAGKALSAAQRRAANMAAKGLERPSAWDWIKQAGFSGIYGPGTAASAAIGGAQELALAQPKELVRALVQGRPGAYGAQVRAQIQAMPEALTGLARVLRGSGAGATAAVSGGSQGTANLSERIANPLGHLAARALERPGELLTEAPDAVFRPLFRAQGLQREARQVAAEMKLRGPQAGTYADALVQDAQAVQGGQLPQYPETQRVIDAAEKYADDLGYKGKPGEFGQWLGKLARRDDALGVAASFLMPFPAMAARMSAAAVKMAPGSALFPSVRRMQPSRFDMIYDQALGTTAAAGVAYWAMHGGITGSGPSDSGKRQEMTAQGWQPNSFLIDGHYIPNRTMGRFQVMLDTAGELHDALAFGKSDRSAPQIATDLVTRAKKIAVDQVGLSGLADLNDLADQGFASQFPGFAARSITRYLPYGGILRAGATATDPLQRRADKWDEGSPLPAIGNQLEMALPGMRSQLPAAQDVLGRPQENPQQGLGALAPRVTTQRNDPAIRLFQDAGVDIGGPRDQMTVGRAAPVDLKPGEQRRWQALRGQFISQYSNAYTGNATFMALPPEQKQKYLQTFLTKAADYADKMLQSEMDPNDLVRRATEGALKRKAS